MQHYDIADLASYGATRGAMVVCSYVYTDREYTYSYSQSDKLQCCMVSGCLLSGALRDRTEVAKAILQVLH